MHTPIITSSGQSTFYHLNVYFCCLKNITLEVITRRLTVTHSRTNSHSLIQPDCEGAGEMFRVTTLPTEGSRSRSSCNVSDGNNNNSEQKMKKTLTDADDFFGKPTFLTVSGQVSF